MSRNIAVIVGSTRSDSINRKLAKALVKLAPKDFEFEFVQIDDLPVFNQDHDQNPPEAVLRVKAQVAKASAFLFVTPEHNRSIPAALKNVPTGYRGPMARAYGPASLLALSGHPSALWGPPWHRHICAACLATSMYPLYLSRKSICTLRRT